jgi:hypothetical protein
VAANKEKGQSGTVAKPELLALAFTFGGLAEWSNAADGKSVNGGHDTVLGFESLTRLKITFPAKALLSARESKRYSRSRTNPQIQYPAFGCETQQEISR